MKRVLMMAAACLLASADASWAAKKAAPTKEEIFSDATAFAKSIALDCAVTDAAVFNDGIAEVNGKKVHLRTFEVACQSGMGYFLVQQDPEPAGGLSCFAAEAGRADDITNGREPGPACGLAPNADTKTIAKTVLSHFGKTCSVTGLRHLGKIAARQSEVNEVACAGGTGYVIMSPLPGSPRPLAVESCADALQHGIRCSLTAVAEPITMKTFSDALVAHHIPCTVEASRVIGKENVSKRHVVEFRCKEQPDGLVAYIPTEAGAAPFETSDCAAAGTRHRIICTLTQPH